MLDFRQNNEPAYYGGARLQKTDDGQLRNVEERHGELRQLETNIVQLHEIHRDFAGLVQEHHQTIDNIESSVTQTETHVQTGNKVLAKSLTLQTAARRKRIICGLITVIILVVIAIIIVVIVITKKKS